MNMSLDEIINKTLPIIKEAGVTSSGIFGSYVHGDNTKDSDIDLLVAFPRGKGLFDLVGLQNRLEKALGKKVDLVTYNSLNPLLKSQILGEEKKIL